MISRLAILATMARLASSDPRTKNGPVARRTRTECGAIEGILYGCGAILPPLKISVVLLTKNGGALLGDCLDAVASQRLGQPYEVIAIDSGSSDGSAELLAADSRVRLVRIPAADFQHGRTRNLAMRTAVGELVVFLTQDAVPAGPG